MMGQRFMLEVILNFLSNSYVDQPTLHTRKINQHIARLRQYDWFHTLYYDEQYGSLFFANRQSYILHSIKVTIQCIRKDHKEVFGRK